MLISVVVPTHNEALTVEILYARISEVLDGAGYDFELIFVDDSTDATPEIIEQMLKIDSRVRLVRLTRSFGQSVAIQAGMDVSRGDAVVMMDADLQDPPEAILAFVDKWRQGAMVVYAERPSQGNLVYVTLSRIFYGTLSRLSGTTIPRNVGEFRLLDRNVVDLLSTLPEQGRFLRGLTLWPGFPSVGIPVQRSARQAGKTNYNLRRSAAVAVDGIVGFSLAPLRAVTLAGALIVGLTATLLLAWIALRAFRPEIFGTGWMSLMLLIFAMGGVNILLLGVVGEYVGRIFIQVQGRPLYVVAHHSSQESE